VRDKFYQALFTDAVTARQEADGVAEKYAHVAARQDRVNLGEEERQFIETRTSFYMASVSDSGWPYVQHRGGPAGFVKVLDETQLGFADYRGNKQLITTGKLHSDNRVSLFAMDYPRKARLKLQGHATLVNAADTPDLAQTLTTPGQGRVERIMTITIAAFDWNCPQFITPRFDASEMTALIGPELSRLETRNAELEAEIADLRDQLRNTK
jgi:predicted pyridoxine 5'-phosphate oxidase superfamily flavin-nucleotide-binding protein